MPAPLPHEHLPSVPELVVESDDLRGGETLSDLHVFNDWGMTGQNRSPQLRWSGAPEGTRGYAVTCYDPDAPTGSGFWHWVLFDLPASVTELPQGAGNGPDFKGLPAGAIHARNDYGTREYGGAAPPPGPAHRYVFTVHALGVDKLGLDGDASPAVVGFTITANTLARGHIIALYGV
ncbi:YbhB/YbcL family Raf kinase inhibitor-like protein [Nonomuraea phyllanthi]|uniref:YbhB/YbcL family Raf kinase inhibitor-like protein n=1 Tax=Nonomuraea phyllanthi TaxID=2219224 RepID=A0A5C4W229_9ACTN|nr:YbhB/YbcL family Raf kinase inhibitor-like protein [Nonomuraea phyllanthi]KAB8191411.1 YbhB/YbcL family Raf kinase inhibitor-like protein [Nonomuraea phyllanthi]QFY13262.1 YbhB/YbcL family Raf kinase inhibitor-like protein [Nonomuraea phyllanthi]